MKTDAPCHDVQALHRAGATIKEIMAITGLSRGGVMYRLYRQPVVKPDRTERRCLCCGKTFLSDGPMNRICVRCRLRANDLSPYTPDVA